jgi:hypothetical protein
LALLLPWSLACNALFGIDDLEFDADGSGGAGGGTTTTTATDGGGTGTTTGTAGGGGGSAPVADYAYRRELTLLDIGDAPLGPNYALSFVIDHEALVAAGKARSDGEDLRVTWESALAEVTELHRVVDPASSWNAQQTRVWFETTPLAHAEHGGYWLLYGLDQPPPALDDPAEVFLLWDDFDSDDTNGWSFAAIDAVSGNEQRQNGMLRLTTRSGSIYGTADAFVFLHRPISGDFVADLHVAGFGGTTGDWSHLGGAMVRQHLGNGSRHVTGTVVVQPDPGAEILSRGTDGGASGHELASVANPVPGYVRVTRLGDDVSAAHSLDGRTWTQAGATRTVTDSFVDPVLVGIPFNNADLGTAGWIEVDWFRLRRTMPAEPTVTVGDEQLR